MQQQARSTVATTFVVEDHLRAMGKKQGRNRLVPRQPHSAFGDFPNSHMPGRNDPRRATF